MTVNEIFERTLSLLGYSNIDGTRNGLEVLESRVVHCVNQILSDLEEKVSVTDLSDNITLTGVGMDALIYGTAMLLALNICDSEKNVLFAGLYNIKRATYKSCVAEKKDVFPVDNGEV
jgi:hypothetical protein